jgi:hypothetical protein
MVDSLFEKNWNVSAKDNIQELKISHIWKRKIEF